MRMVGLTLVLAGALWGQAPGAGMSSPAVAPGPPGVTERQAEEMQRKLADWGQLGYYRAANERLRSATPVRGRVVFYGASMTENWGKNGSVFFPGKGYINRGIGGQTTAQMLVRFRQDVIELRPQVVVILGGTNDVAGNTGPMTPEMTEGNWTSMAELGRANGIRVVFASVTPSTDFPWRRGLQPAGKIRALNAWLKGYCERNGLIYLDYYSVLTDADGGMQAELTVDGVHATAKGYAAMMPLAQAAIDRALASPVEGERR